MAVLSALTLSACSLTAASEGEIEDAVAEGLGLDDGSCEADRDVGLADSSYICDAFGQNVSVRGCWVEIPSVPVSWVGGCRRAGEGAVPNRSWDDVEATLRRAGFATEFIVYLRDPRGEGLEASFHITGADQYINRVAMFVFAHAFTAREYEWGRRPLNVFPGGATESADTVIRRGRILGWTAEDVPPAQVRALRRALFRLPAWVVSDSSRQTRRWAS